MIWTVINPHLKTEETIDEKQRNIPETQPVLTIKQSGDEVKVEARVWTLEMGLTLWVVVFLIMRSSTKCELWGFIYLVFLVRERERERERERNPTFLPATDQSSYIYKTSKCENNN